MRSMQAVLFDFDGTLAELNVDFIRMRTAVLDLMSRYCNPADGMKDLYVLEMIEAGKQLISENCPGAQDEFFLRAHELIRGIETAGAKGGTLFTGTEEMLSELRRRHIKIGIVSRNCIDAIRQIFPDIDSRCDTIITREYTARVKPHPDHLLTALENLGTDPEFATMVGDHPMDITVGRDIGAYTVGVLTGYSEAASLRQAGADLIIERAPDIIRYI
ncbi:MAG TPA: HAD family hydrolase [Syntrophales bacterium]|nr:HAD family hydrolase [Syntrophales bacterium]HPQ42848.1 HAD family hydrolase [Syntrophales bacterium]